MAVKCVECVHLSRKDTPREMRDLRLLRCARGQRWEFYPPEFPRECAKFKPEAADVVAQRRAWIHKQDGAQRAEESQHLHT